MFLASLEKIDSMFYTLIGVIVVMFGLVWLIATPIIAAKKGRSAFGWFWLAVLLGFIAFIIICCVKGEDTRSYYYNNGYSRSNYANNNYKSGYINYGSLDEEYRNGNISEREYSYLKAKRSSYKGKIDPSKTPKYSPEVEKILMDSEMPNEGKLKELKDLLKANKITKEEYDRAIGRIGIK